VGHGFNPDYVIGVGDRLQLRMWGAFTFDASVIVDPQGNIFIRTWGPWRCRHQERGAQPGGRARRAQDLQAEYRCLCGARSSQPVKVYVTGFVRQPGLYSGVAADSPISYIDKAGGVDPERGSYVDIVIKRGSLIRKRVNLYSFLLDGTLDLTQFQDGDVILIGPRQHTFSVAGEAYNAYDFEFGEPTVRCNRRWPWPNPSRVRPMSASCDARASNVPRVLSDTRVCRCDAERRRQRDRDCGSLPRHDPGPRRGRALGRACRGAALWRDAAGRADADQAKPMSRLDALQIYRRSVAERQKEMLLVSLRKLEEATLSARSASIEEAGLRAKESESIMRFVERAKSIEPKGQIILNEAQREATLLQDGDLIVIPERTSLVMVHGEVLFPNAVSWQSGLAPDGYIRKAGGYTQGADTSRVLVIHQNAPRWPWRTMSRSLRR